MAPEVIKGTVCQSPHGWKRADVWSLGCTVIEMMTGRMPWLPKFTNPIAAMYVRLGRPPYEFTTG
jgi:serine/threonine protein kinase